MTTTPLLTLSVKESELSGLRIARGGRVVSFNPYDLKDEIVAGNYDLCRLKIKADDDSLFDKLSQIGFPFFLYSVIVRNSTTITPTDILSVPDTELEFKTYRANQSDVLANMIRNSILQRSATNYKKGLYEQLFPLEVELAAAIHYYTTEFAHDAGKPENIGWLIKEQSNYIGFVMCSVSEMRLEGVFYGIDPDYRGSKKHARTIMRFLKKYGAENGLSHFDNDVVVPNFPSLRSIIGENILPKEAYMNVAIYPCISFQGVFSQISSPRSKDLSVDWICRQIQNLHQKPVRLKQFQRQMLYSKQCEQPSEISINRLTENAPHTLYTIKYFAENCLSGIDYIEMEQQD